jgi:hypothetical protein
LGYDIVLFYGTAFVPLFQNYDNHPGHTKRHYNQQDAIRGLAWSGQSGQRLAGEAVFVDQDTHITIECITHSRLLPIHKLQSPRLLAAYNSARALK